MQSDRTIAGMKTRRTADRHVTESVSRTGAAPSAQTDSASAARTGSVAKLRSTGQAAKRKNAGSPPLRFGFLIHDVSRLRRTFFDQRLKPLGVTRSQWWVLGHLSRAKGAPMSQVELAKLLDVGKAALGDLVDRLESTGYVSRSVSPSDARIKQVSLTDQGREFLKILEREGRELNEVTTAGIDPKKVAVFEEVLAAIKHNLSALVKSGD